MSAVASSIPPGDAPSPAPEPTRRERLRRWVLGRQEQLEAARGTSPTVGFAFDAFSYDTDTGAPVLAAALAFRVFLFQVPYVCVFVIGAGFVSDLTGRSVESFFHGRGITRLTAESVSGAAEFSEFKHDFSLSAKRAAQQAVTNLVKALESAPELRM